MGTNISKLYLNAVSDISKQQWIGMYCHCNTRYLCVRVQ